MTARNSLAAAVAVCALAAPATAAAQDPDLAQMTLGRADLPAGTSVQSEGQLTLDDGTPLYFRDFKLARRSGFARLDASVVLAKNAGDATQLLDATRSLLRDRPTARLLARATAAELGVNARRVQVGKPRPLHVGDGGFTVNIRANRKVAIAVGIFRLDRALAEIDARGARGKSKLLKRTRAVLRVSAERARHGLSPVSLTPPTIAGGTTVGALLQSTPGTWGAATKPTSFRYVWQRCDAAGTCAAISGATQPSYTVAAGDVGFTLRVVVTAANAVGQTTAVSAPTAPIPSTTGG
jgi:hypothetical protein